MSTAPQRTSHQPVPARAPGLKSEAPVTRDTARKASRDTRRRRNAYTFGLFSEDAVCRFLHAAGYTILARRKRIGQAEVDVIAVRDGTVAFVEVKARRTIDDGLTAIDAAKQRRLARAARAWLAQNDAFGDHTIRFDIALVGPGGAFDYLEDAFADQDPWGSADW